MTGSFHKGVGAGCVHLSGLAHDLVQDQGRDQGVAGGVLAVADKLAVALKDQVEGLVAPAVMAPVAVHAEFGPLGKVLGAIGLGGLRAGVEGDAEEGVFDDLEGGAVLGVEDDEVLAGHGPGVAVVAGQEADGRGGVDSLELGDGVEELSRWYKQKKPEESY